MRIQMKKLDPSGAKAQARKVIGLLRKEFPGASTALEFRSPYELLVATILSAQCTDERVNKVTPGLFKKYPDARRMAAADLPELEQEVRSTGFFRMKAKNIRACSATIVERHGGQVPRSFDELVALPGVGRKTANCVMGAAYGVNSGVVVDTHVHRISRLLGLTQNDDPVNIEQDLMPILPQNDWYDFSNLIILHGRRTCIARRPKCAECVLSRICPSATHVPSPKIAPKTNGRMRS
ncbi:MAG: endonuclease III [Bacteroidetes bacterium]|nr:endonuclease III [Bacteroidota bacterium]